MGTGDLDEGLGDKTGSHRCYGRGGRLWGGRMGVLGITGALWGQTGMLEVLWGERGCWTVEWERWRPQGS